MLGLLQGSPRLSFVTHLLMGWTAVDDGDLDTAEAYARATCATTVVPELATGGRALFARVLARRGDLDAALAEASAAAHTHAGTHHLELFEGLPDAALVEVHLARADADAARKATERGYERVAKVVTIAGPERKARFWARRIGVDRIRRESERLGIGSFGATPVIRA